MNKRFNTTGLCLKDRHYMINIDNKLKKIKELVDNESYFTINRARQYGKTTTLKSIKNYLHDEYNVISISFEECDYIFESNELFCREFINLLYNYCSLSDMENNILELLSNVPNGINFVQLSQIITKLCKVSTKPMILMIDEVDQAGNYEVFVRFLGMLRNKYLTRDEAVTFHSVILAGVYDVKNLKLKMRSSSEHQYNSPWNIAEDFNVEMSFSPSEISTMLIEYEKDHGTGMDINEISQLIYDYTTGYPYLVSLICKTIDEQFNKDFTVRGIKKAVKYITSRTNTLFQDMIKNIQKYQDLSKLIQNILFNGKDYLYHPDSYIVNIGIMLGFLMNDQGKVTISNRIFETYLYDYFITEETINKTVYEVSKENKNQFIKDNKLDMKKVVIKFSEYFNEIYNDKDNRFVEENGRKIFLMYLKPIINGEGNYYVEARTRNQTRTDIIVDYSGRQYIIELKIWRGKSYNDKGIQQLAEYLEMYHQKQGYLISFNFNKNKEVSVKEIAYHDKIIIEAII